MRSGTFALIALVSVSGANQQTSPARDREIKPTIGTAAISGVVVTGDQNQQPVRRAVVSLAGSELRPGRGAVTDDEGRFTIGNLPAGRFSLTVTRAAYLTSAYGAKRPGRPGTPIVVAEGEHVRGLNVRIWRGAAIGGVLRDDTGAPVQGIPVTAIPARRPANQPVLTLSNNGASTDDRGEFRIYGLEPGTYVVTARPASGGASEIHALTEAAIDAALDTLRRRTPAASPLARAEALPTPPRSFDYAPVYYPGTSVLAQATLITLAEGQELTNLDFAVQRVPTSFVEGTVHRPDGQPAAGATLQMTAIVLSGPFASGSPINLNATAGTDGRFRFNQVTPGNYRLVARAPEQISAAPATGGIVRPGGSGPNLWAAQDLSIGGADVQGVALALQPGATISGQVVFQSESVAPPGDLTRLRVMLMPVAYLNARAGTSIDTIAFAAPVTVRADGTFAISNVPPGVFRLTISGPPVDNTSWWARSALAGERDLLDGLVDVGLNDTITGVQVTFSDRHTELSGALQTATGAPASDVFVIAYAADRRFWGPHARRVQAVRPGVDGQFSIKNLPPGEYLLSAVTDIDQDEWQDPAFLERLVAASVKISIAEGEKKVQNLRLGGG